ncbi:MAG: ATP-binding protein [Candidatus Paceibacterota bacterium]|jgi:signal transduction histidine kinase
MDIISISLTLVSLITAGLSLFIIRGEDNASNKVFSLFILSISLWAFGLLMFRLTDNLEYALYYTRFYYITAAAIPFFFLNFSYTFPKKITLTIAQRFYIYLPFSLITLGILISPHFILQSVYFLESGIKSATVNTFGYTIYVIYFIASLVVAYSNLFKSFNKSNDHTVKIQLKFIFLGTILPYLIAMYFDLISPPYDYTHIWIGPLMAFIVAWVLLYAVYKHNLLNAKVITTEMFTACLWIFILVRVLLAETDQDRLLNIGLLILTIIVGSLLIRSVRQEVKHREKIELLATDLEKANTRLTELDRQKSEFVSFATHQLRGPLTAMKGYSSLILEGDMGEISTEVRNGVTRIFDSTNTLVNIVNDYLNLSRIELGAMKYAFETIDLKTMIEDVVAELKPNIDKTGVKLTFTAENHGIDYRTTADRDKLKQVVANIIDNSLKYTPSGSIDAKLSYDKSRHLFIFAVKDTGVGIAPETLPRLFQKFSRAENASKTNIRGTGLGLYVAKQMIEAHHGTIRAESPGEGKGATFIVELEPFAKA